MIGIKLIGTRSKIVKKGKSGLVIYLNPKNWGLTDYDTDTFSEAFGKARSNGDKEFLWNGKRYTTKLISSLSLEKFDSQINWIRNYFNSFPTDSIPLSYLDSLLARTYASDRYKKSRDSIFSFLDYSERIPNWYELLVKARTPNSLDYKELKKKKLNNIKDKLNGIKPSQFIVTDLPDPNYSANGWHDREAKKIYVNLNSPGTLVHELSHYSDADKLYEEIGDVDYDEVIRTEVYRNPGSSSQNILDFIRYQELPNEVYARLLQKRYLIDPNDTNRRDITEEEYYDNKEGLTKFGVDKSLYGMYDKFKINFKF